MPRLLTLANAGLCLLLALLALLRWGAGPVASGPFRVDSLALFLGAAVLLVSAVVHAFSLRFMAGDARFAAFFPRLSALAAAVLLLLAADNLLLFAGLWVAMGWLLADLIGHVRGWRQAAAAAALARAWFLRGAAALAAGLALLGWATGSLSISGVVAGAAAADGVLVGLGCALLGLAAAIQSGLFPFHRWLMSSMTAPTPVSAFMHAGLVNAGGVLVARFAPAFEAAPAILALVFLAGAASALFGALAALVQSDVKRGLAASTTAQMGFMLLQCGLGFHAAAMAHLVLHGLYKASLFLGAGSGLAQARRPGAEARPAAPVAAIALAAAIAAGAGFALTSGKLDGGAGGLLVLFAALAAAQAVVALAGQPARMLLLAPSVLAVAGALYGALVAGVEALLAGTPGLVAPQPFTALHALAAAAFTGIWIAVQAGLHRRSVALYAWLVALSQPAAAAVTDRREAHHA
ncbi:proton-conducting transporter membrane subunit [Falsiroseomonas sp. CW058]|uniref:proton-conducting transporter transmembrane domain-containing protein n=1 Tax=Falsiroseomonas sp. CW058 TaxID=3388664 RepID=UPI003D323429